MGVNSVIPKNLAQAQREGWIWAGYTSDEQGIRHALLEQGSANVGLEEALFMFGACASFAAYLTEKHRQVKIVGS